MENEKSPYLKRKELELRIELTESAKDCPVKYVAELPFGVLDVREYKDSYLICFVGSQGNIHNLVLIPVTEKTSLDIQSKVPGFGEYITNVFDQALFSQPSFEPEATRIVERSALFEEKEEEFAFALLEIAKTCPIKNISHETELGRFEIREHGVNYLGVSIGNEEGVQAAVQIGEPESRLLDKLFFDTGSNQKWLEVYLEYIILEALEYQDRFFQA